MKALFQKRPDIQVSEAFQTVIIVAIATDVSFPSDFVVFILEDFSRGIIIGVCAKM